MEKISKKEMNFRIEKLKKKVEEINYKIDNNNKELDAKYNFAKELGIKKKNANDTTEITEGLNSYLNKVDEVLLSINKSEEELTEECSILNNILYLDDRKLNNINELVQENKELSVREYINCIADRANDLIRQEEISDIDSNIDRLSKKPNIVERITGKAKVKKVLLENYNLKKLNTMNKKYIPENKSILEIVNITKNCGYKSQDIDSFITKLSNEYNLGEIEEKAIALVNDKVQIPFFYNKEFVSKINSENATMLDIINEKKKETNKISEYKMYSDMLKNDVSTLELLNFNMEAKEVI